jgi:D-alanyl-D-alanine carboxypeptidase
MYCVSKSQAPARRFASLVVAALALTLTIAATRPVDAADPRAASMVVDANTGAVLHNKGGDELVYPASLTKMMTLYMTFELIELGRLNYDSKIKMTQEGADAAPSKLDLDAGEELTVVDAIKALVTKSANDVAIALAMHIGGTETNFARLMTRKARELGMQNTTFRNASGLPDPEQKTTARDMITLGLRLQDDFPRHYRLFSTRTFSFRGKTYRNHNSLLTRYQGTDGIKTGYTRASGFNLVSSVRRNGKHVVAAVFGGDTARERNAKMQSLLSSALAKASREVPR